MCKVHPRASLLSQSFLAEFHELNDNWGGVNTYLRSGPRVHQLQSGAAKLEVPIQVAARRSEGEKRKGSPEENADPQGVFEGFGAYEAGGGTRLSKEQTGLLEKCALCTARECGGWSLP